MNPALLPPLRQELAMYRADGDASGAPGYTLHDPVTHRYFHIGWPAFEMLSRWHLGRADLLVEAIARETTLELSMSDVDAAANFLAEHHLLRADNPQVSLRLKQVARASRSGGAAWLLKHYLFFRVPLFNPMALLRRLQPWMRWAFHPVFWWLVLASAGVGVALAAQQWDSFVHTFSAYATWQGLLAMGLALSLAKVAHEFGHALTAHRYGCRVPAMGVAFMVMVPVLYTDTNEAWKLPSTSQRLRIAVAGVATELALASIATLAWSFLSDGPLRSAVFLLATTTWVATLAINVSPFMRFDGYFVLSDWLGVPNLHERSFALARWQMREWLFGFGRQPPEAFAHARRRGLVAFAFATWLYRLVVFTGIAVLVYGLFFKLLGLALMAVELGWFIARPIFREFVAWCQLRRAMRWNACTVRTTAVLTILLALLWVPWPQGERAGAVLSAAQAQWLYAPAPAVVRNVSVPEGATVRAGQMVVELASSSLESQLRLAAIQESRAAWQLDQQPFEERLLGRGAVLAQRLQATRDELQGTRALLSQLQLRSAFNGRVTALMPAARIGTWVQRGERIAQIAATDGVKLEAFVDEGQAQAIEVGAAARFIADDPALPRVDCRVGAIDPVAIAQLDYPELASVHGGPIASRADVQGHAIPLNATFKVRLQDCRNLPRVFRTHAGRVAVDTGSRCLACGWLRRAGALLRREGGA